MKILMLTDHSTHTAYDSVYALPKAMANYSSNIKVYAASRAVSTEHFLCRSPLIDYCQIDSGFCFERREQYFNKNKMSETNLAEFDVIFFRIDRPVPDEYLAYCRKTAPTAIYINSPEGLIKTGSKQYLVNFRPLCPEFIIANSLEEIRKFAEQFEIVLKPLGGYGGDGLIRVTSFDEIHVGSEIKTGWDSRRFLKNIPATDYPIMAMKYLDRVNEGDKRILVVAGVCLGAVLRIPKRDSWLCNMAQGATSIPATVAEEELSIVSQVDSLLAKEGINVYGIDTLVNDDGKRVMSEINTTNVGGFVQLEQTSSEDVLGQAVKLIFDRINEA